MKNSGVRKKAANAASTLNQALAAIRLRGAVRPEVRPAESQARADGDGGRSVAALPGKICMIPAYSLQARGRSERRFGTWQGRLPQMLRLAGITTLEESKRFLRERYIPEMNRKFGVVARQPGHAFVALHGQDLDRIFLVQTEQVVGKDNTVQIADRRCRSSEHPAEERWQACSIARKVLIFLLGIRLYLWFRPWSIRLRGACLPRA